MKNFFLFILLSITISCSAQVYPLRTFTDIPENSYLKDTNNELPNYEGIWKGIWENKTILITFKKINNKYDNILKRNRDYLIGKFKVIDSNNGNVLFDNTTLPDEQAKIQGTRFRKEDDRYSLFYIDKDLCGATGSIRINFTDASKTKLNWQYFYRNEIISSSCQYYNTSIPQALPKEIVLTKQ
ncbi:DUF6705 family protein [Chryseobacterium sp. 'Rf worker isolate 10']|uniref:DUF6705 family protein n=1 Tax=Chryseobacterium sp. 'Rf worker isolate 10' TaxID=2887348 RepID=UPI003D6FD123